MQSAVYSLIRSSLNNKTAFLSQDPSIHWTAAQFSSEINETTDKRLESRAYQVVSRWHASDKQKQAMTHVPVARAYKRFFFADWSTTSKPCRSTKCDWKWVAARWRRRSSGLSERLLLFWASLWPSAYCGLRFHSSTCCTRSFSWRRALRTTTTGRSRPFQFISRFTSSTGPTMKMLRIIQLNRTSPRWGLTHSRSFENFENARDVNDFF